MYRDIQVFCIFNSQRYQIQDVPTHVFNRDGTILSWRFGIPVHSIHTRTDADYNYSTVSILQDMQGLIVSILHKYVYR